ncbi:MAG: hypothetical protein ACLS3T_14355 [Anaerobutyricum sp.]
MNLFEITTLVSVIVLFLFVALYRNKLTKKKQDEKAKELKLQSVVESAILPYNMGKNIDYVKNTIVKSKLSTEFHLLK